jgi:hypothetical protein
MSIGNVLVLTITSRRAQSHGKLNRLLKRVHRDRLLTSPPILRLGSSRRLGLLQRAVDRQLI